MADILTYITYATIGAFIALMIRESFIWKGQGRIEAIKRYETLLTECYGILLPLIESSLIVHTTAVVANNLYLVLFYKEIKK